ncbi:MAG: 1-deoxy-D-xylulose-5-phosphate synthase [Oscillospiraceae bacterium]|nr:1-deoxy-D-xylulose-5-phosphate synthase [Oscillospiraceae bacterium]
MSILESIHSPEDLKKVRDLDALASEMRERIVEVVSRNGGHLSSNLGSIELTLALLAGYWREGDDIVWDVGHQSYAYKLLTGRFLNFGSLRQSGGLSGFTDRQESYFDKFTSGHSGVSVSAALGLSVAKNYVGSDAKTVAVLGDGAVTCGLSYEGINNSGGFAKNFLVILNDNSMSISKNVGSISKYLANIRAGMTYINMKSVVQKFLSSVPIFGSAFFDLLAESRNVLKNSFWRESTIFENMGFKYYGPFDGHDIQNLIRVFKVLRSVERPVLLHVVTKKGKGYRFSEKNPEIFHSISKFSKETGKISHKVGVTFSEIFGKKMCEIARKNQKIYAITAAMTLGVGLEDFSKMFPKRFRDVGIAESHAVTFAGGLAVGGMIPVVAVYSTFLQRSIDQVIHDVAMQNIKVIFAVDRAGLVGSDGKSHQGIFDVSLLNSVPFVKIYAPAFLEELEFMLEEAVNGTLCSVVRYPKGGEFFRPEWFSVSCNNFDIYSNYDKKDLLIITYGRIFSFVAKAYEHFDKSFSLMKLNVIKPIDKDALSYASMFTTVLFFEESVKSGSVGSSFASGLSSVGFKGKYILNAIDDDFVAHNEVEAQLFAFGLDFESIRKKINEFI